ncbi:MAG: orotidine-5'-phosphate decarboxylase, partial [Planctomycetota bacterium]
MVEGQQFADRLFHEIDEKQSQVVVGLDPRMNMMPEEVIEGVGRSAEGAAEAIVRFNEGVLDAVSDIAAAVKPQIAFYERYGLAGLSAYVRTIQMARERDLLVIGDVKRNDIGSTAEAYAEGHLNGRDGDDWAVEGGFHADAITINPLFGSDGIEPFVRRAATGGGGLFVLAKTSNPSSAEIQDLACPKGPVYERISELIDKWGEEVIGECGYSLVGAVVGATFPA